MLHVPLSMTTLNNTQLDWRVHCFLWIQRDYKLNQAFLGAIHTSELDRSEIAPSPKRSLCERSNANCRSIQDRSKWVWTLSQSELRSIWDRSNFRSILVWTAPNQFISSTRRSLQRVCEIFSQCLIKLNQNLIDGFLVYGHATLPQTYLNFWCNNECFWSAPWKPRAWSW